MKRSRSITLGLLLGGTAVTLFSCGETPSEEAITFFAGDKRQAVARCVDSGLSPETCDTAYDEAEAEDRKHAPFFVSHDECEAETGSSCAKRPAPAGDGTVAWPWAPAMGGFAVTALSLEAVCRAGQVCRPLYQGVALYGRVDAPGRYHVAARLEVGGGVGFSGRTGTVARGGFGGRGGGRGG